MRPARMAANQNAQRFRAGRSKPGMVPPLHWRGAAESGASDWSVRRSGRGRGGAPGEGYIRRDSGAPPRTRALGGLGVCARCLPARVRDLPDSAVRALAAPALRGPGRRAACDSRARRSRSGTALGFGGGPGLVSTPPAARRAAGHRVLTLPGGRPPPRVVPGLMPT